MLMNYFSLFPLLSLIVYHLCIYSMLKINSKIDITNFIQRDCSIVSKIGWKGYIFAMVVLMSVFIF